MAGSDLNSAQEEPTAPTQTTGTTYAGITASETTARQTTGETTGGTTAKVEPSSKAPDLVVCFPEQEAPYNCPGATHTCLVSIEVEVVNQGDAPSNDTKLLAVAGAEQLPISIGKLDPQQTASATFNFSTACYTPSCDVTASVDSVAGEQATNNNSSDFGTTLRYGTDHCMRPFLWREAFTNDRVCVPANARDQAILDNTQAASRVSETETTYGADTCEQGYVWREATSNDHVCVTPDVRSQTAEQNRLAPCRLVVPVPASSGCT